MKKKHEQPKDLTPDAKEALRVENRFVEIGRFNSIKEKRLRDLYFIWCNPINVEGKKQSLRMDEIKELRESDIIKNATEEDSSRPVAADTDGSDICYTNAEIADRMMLHYQNDDKSSKLRTSITGKMISAWSLGRDLKDTPKPPKDLEGSKKRMSFSAWCQWFDTYLWHKFRRDAGQKHDSLSLEVSTRELEERAERSRYTRQLLEDEVAAGKYIELDRAEQIAAGEMGRKHLEWKNEVENIPMDAIELKMQQLEIAPDKAAAMKDYLSNLFQAITNTIENESAKAEREMSKALKADAGLKKK